LTIDAATPHPPGSIRPSAGTRARRVAGSPAIRTIVRRLLWAIPLLFVVTATSFVLVALTPGDAARSMVGADAPEDVYFRLRHSLGLDLPLYEQYWRWLTHSLHGDFGISVVSGESVTHVIDSRLPVTLSLIAGGLVVTMLIGVGIGVFSATRGGTIGRAVDGFALLGFALPSFWVGAVLIEMFAVKRHWLPATGYVPLATSPRSWARSLVLPVTALALHSVAAIAKQTREAMLDALGSEYIRMAWASGLSRRSIVYRHALRNASIRVVTILGLLVVGLLGGTVYVESVFALPGLGSLAVTSATQHDLPMIQGIVVYFVVIVVAVNLVIDLAYTWLDPRVRTE
jgi:peptide/nickel transport system permease protein